MDHDGTCFGVFMSSLTNVCNLFPSAGVLETVQSVQYPAHEKVLAIAEVPSPADELAYIRFRNSNKNSFVDDGAPQIPTCLVHVHFGLHLLTRTHLL